MVLILLMGVVILISSRSSSLTVPNLRAIDSIRENVHNNWRLLAKKYGINRSEIERMNVAFRECE